MQSASAPAALSSHRPEHFVPATGRRIAVFVILALLAGIGATMWLESLRFEKFSGYLQARLRTVTAGREARVAKFLVGEGAVVVAGQPIVVLEDESLNEKLRACREEIESLEIELSRTQAALEVELDIQRRDVLDRIFETKWRSAQLLRQQFLIPNEPSVEGQLAGQWNSGLRPVAPLVQRSSLIFDHDRPAAPSPASQPGMRNVDGLHRAMLAEMELCNEHIRELEAMSRDLPAKISRSMGVDLAQARLAHAQAALAALESEEKALTIVAEAPGMIGVFQKQPGDRVGPDEPIVQLLDEEQPYLIVQLPSPRIADFAPGTQVELRFPGGKKGKGRVEEIPPQTSSLPEGAGPVADTTITAHVDRVGALWPELPFGSVVEVRRRR